jgi:hypothetical protein
MIDDLDCLGTTKRGEPRIPSTCPATLGGSHYRPWLFRHDPLTKRITSMLNPNTPLPNDVYERLPGREAVLDQKIKVGSARWRKAISARNLPLPVGKLGKSEDILLSRSDVFDVADRTPTPESAFQLLWYSLAWGLGPRAPRLHARLDAIADDRKRASRLLTDAWLSALDGGDPETTYRILTTDRGAARIKWLGPAFSTKFLYFAQGHAMAAKYLILDKVVATKLQSTAWPDAPTAAWWPSTYGSYCVLMQHWATAASDKLDREVSPDEISSRSSGADLDPEQIWRTGSRERMRGSFGY